MPFVIRMRNDAGYWYWSAERHAWTDAPGDASAFAVPGEAEPIASALFAARGKPFREPGDPHVIWRQRSYVPGVV